MWVWCCVTIHALFVLKYCVCSLCTSTEPMSVNRREEGKWQKTRSKWREQPSYVSTRLPKPFHRSLLHHTEHGTIVLPLAHLQQLDVQWGKFKRIFLYHSRYGTAQNSSVFSHMSWLNQCLNAFANSGLRHLGAAKN